jgi:hypothetical protein
MKAKRLLRSSAFLLRSFTKGMAWINKELPNSSPLNLKKLSKILKTLKTTLNTNKKDLKQWLSEIEIPKNGKMLKKRWFRMRK